MKIPYNFIAIEGILGVGKSTLAERLSRDFNGRLLLESFEENPFLPMFYENPDKYAFPVELSFMAERFQQLNDQLLSPDLFHDFIVSDYITEKSLIFAGKTLGEDVFALYSKLFHIIFSRLPQPDLLVYLYASPAKSKQNILRRGRDYEKNIEEAYLQKLQEGYMQYINEQNDRRILILDTENIDFVHSEEDYEKVYQAIFKEYEPGIHRVLFPKHCDKARL